MINQIGDLKLNIDQQTGEFVWAYNDLKIYATRDDNTWERFVNIRIWAKDHNGNEYESSGDGFFLSPGTQCEQMSEYIRVITAIESVTIWTEFWEHGIKNLDGVLAYVFREKLNKFLTK